MLNDSKQMLEDVTLTCDFLFKQSKKVKEDDTICERERLMLIASTYWKVWVYCYIHHSKKETILYEEILNVYGKCLKDFKNLLGEEDFYKVIKSTIIRKIQIELLKNYIIEIKQTKR